jgi:hypothetical protein
MIRKITSPKYLIDLSFGEKFCYFFLWMIMIRFYRPYFLFNGYKLKSQQANYYGVLGFSFFFIMLGTLHLSNYACLYVWSGGFILAYIFDVKYNRQRQINYLQRK